MLRRLGIGVVAMGLACGWPAEREGAEREGAEPIAPVRGGGEGRRAPKGEWLREIHVESGGMDRTALLHVPEGGTGKMPLLVLFHGGQGAGGDDGSKMAAHWSHLQDQGYLMVFPNAVGTGERAWAGPDDRRDIAFVDDLLDQLVRDEAVDPSRIYAAGFSNGSGMVWMLECLATDRFAGFGHAEQAMAEAVRQRCRPTKHVPTIYLHGDADPKAVWDGNNGTIGVPRTMEFVLGYHGCDPAKNRVTELPDLPGDDTRVTKTLYTDCAEVSAIELYRIHGGTHHWPTQGRSKREADGRCSDIDGSAEMVSFWKEYAGM